MLWGASQEVASQAEMVEPAAEKASEGLMAKGLVQRQARS